MAKEYTQDELLRKAASYCSIAEHCVSDVDGKLQRWNVPADWRAQIIDRLIADGFINESRYAGPSSSTSSGSTNGEKRK